MIKAIISVFICLSSLEIAAEGFLKGTVVLTANGMCAIEALTKENFLITESGASVPIVQVSRRIGDEYIELCVGQESICCHPKQQLFSVDRHAFIQAEDFYVGEQLLTFDGAALTIDSIEQVKKEAVMYGLSVPYPHYVWIGKHKILAHNIAPAIGVGIVFAVEAGVFEFVSASFFAGIATVGGIVLGSHFSKKTNKAIECKPGIGVETPLGPVFPGQNNDDEKDKEKKKHPNGKYEDADYHTAKGNAQKSPRPKDGQEALDNSFKFNPNSEARVAIQDNEFVILRPTGKGSGVYHGYRCSWKDVPNEAQTFLRKFGLVNKKGNIL